MRLVLNSFSIEEGRKHSLHIPNSLWSGLGFSTSTVQKLSLPIGQNSDEGLLCLFIIASRNNFFIVKPLVFTIIVVFQWQNLDHGGSFNEERQAAPRVGTISLWTTGPSRFHASRAEAQEKKGRRRAKDAFKRSPSIHSSDSSQAE